jgi:hypothetical protein
MVRRITPVHDVDMHPPLALSDQDRALAASAHQLQRAAGTLHKLRDSELACASSRDWTRRLLGNPPTDR